MKFLLLLSIISGSYTLIFPHTYIKNLISPRTEDHSRLISVSQEAARAMIKNWSLKLFSNDINYPEDSLDACNKGIRHLTNRPPCQINTFLVYGAVHEDIANDDFFLSHILLCSFNPVCKRVIIEGVIESADNVYHNKSIIPLILQYGIEVKANSCHMEILPYRRWNYRQVYFEIIQELLRVDNEFIK